MKKISVGKLCSFMALTMSLALHAQPHKPADFPSAELPEELDRVLREYESAWEGDSGEEFAQLFTEDGFVLSGGDTPAKGREIIAARYGFAGGPLKLRAMHYEIDDSLAYIFGFYTYTEGSDLGKFVLTLRKIDNRWLITSDQDNPLRSDDQ